MSRPYEYHWMFGMFNHIHFPGGGDPVDAGYSHIETGEGCATLSDASGDLMFFTEGVDLWAGSPTASGGATTGYGGSRGAACSAVIIPPAGGGSHYHIIGTTDAVNVLYNSNSSSGTVTWTAVSFDTVNRSTAIENRGSLFGVNSIQPDLITFSGSSEHLAAYPHANQNEYFLVAIDWQNNNFVVYHIDSDDWGLPANLASRYSVQPYGSNAGRGFCMKFSRDGSLLAVTNHAEASIDFFKFDRMTGQLTPHYRLLGIAQTAGYSAYGVEFSPNGQWLYYTHGKGGQLRRHPVQPASTSASNQTESTTNEPILFTHTVAAFYGFKMGGLQLGPNDKIYGVKANQQTLFVINDPDNPGNPSIDASALEPGGNTLTTNDVIPLGLPNFVLNWADAPAYQGGSGPNPGGTTTAPQTPCETIISDLDGRLNTAAYDNARFMAECHRSSKFGPKPKPANCRTVNKPKYKPRVHIGWGRTKADQIESTDTECLTVTVCNPYDNLDFTNVVIAELEVVDANGNPVGTLPNGDPDILIKPAGPFCFGQISGCSCKSREFMMDLRGAVPGEYHIRVKALCYDVSLHYDMEMCFKFEVKPD